MAFASVNAFGASDPAGGYLQESSQEESLEVATCRDATGNTVLAVAKGMVTKTTTIKGKGTYRVTQITRNNDIGNSVIMSAAKTTESAEDFPEYEFTYTSYRSN
jgi:Na+/H+-translocating membrane pyrophosphatase